MLDKIAVYFSSTVGMALAAVAAALALALGVQTLRVGSWQKDYAKLEEKSKREQAQLALDVSVYKREAGNWKESSEKQSAAADKARQDGLLLEKKVGDILAEQAKRGKKEQEKVTKLLEWVPPKVGNDCEEAGKQIQQMKKERGLI